MYRTIAIDKTIGAVRERERERESYSLNKVNFACVIPSVLNKNRIIKGRVILSCDYFDTG